MRNVSVEPGWGAFNGTDGKRDEYVVAQSRHGFHATVGAVVLSYLFFREMPRRSACPSTLIDSAAELIAVVVLIASWHPRCEDTDRLFWTAPLTHMRCDASWCLCQEQFTDTETNKYVFCCNVAKHGIEHDHLRAAVVIQCQLRDFVRRPCFSLHCEHRAQV